MTDYNIQPLSKKTTPLPSSDLKHLIDFFTLLFEWNQKEKAQEEQTHAQSNN